MSVLSAIAHGHGDVDTAVAIALSAFTASESLDEDTRALYFDLVEAALSDAARKAFAMLPQNYQFQGPSFLKGKLEGRALGEASSIIAVLETRSIPVGEEQRKRILSCTDLATLERWVRKAVTARSVDELFEL